MKPVNTIVVLMQASFQVVIIGQPAPRLVRLATMAMPPATFLAFPPFRQAAARIRRLSMRATPLTSGPLPSTTAARTTPTAATCTILTRVWVGASTSSTTVILSVVFAIKKKH